MQNLEIEKSKLSNIENNTTNLVGVINEGIAWLENYEKNNQFENYELKKYRRTLNKIKAVVTEKPAIALFGASQVGKSYMANNLLYDEYNKLMIYNHISKENINFLSEINPIGDGIESTSTVTRFSSDMETDSSLLPVKIKIFSPKDIICILCDTYFSDYTDSKSCPDEHEIIKLTQYINNKHINESIQTLLTEDDIYEIKEYIEKYAKDKLFIATHINKKYWIDFWDTLGKNIQKISFSNWINIFQVLWNAHIEINDLFTLCINELNRLKFPKMIYSSFDTIFRSFGMSIIDVKTIRRYFFNENSKLHNIQLHNKELTTINAGKLCFLCSEIVLNISQESIKNRPFIKNSDIIDFPGARSRPILMTLPNDNLVEMLLRGKVAYLFNNYSSTYKTNTLCVCMKTGNSGAKSVPGLIKQWIYENLGNTPIERGNNITSTPPPLFVIFTWWNTELTFNKDAGNLSEDPITSKIDPLFAGVYREEIISENDWDKNWIKKNNITTRFSNFYLLRDFKKSEKIFIKINGKEEESELFTNELQKEYYKNYLNKFIEYHKKENRLFDNPEENFNEASTPNKDGSELIIRRLTPIATNSVSVPIYLNTISQTLSKAKDILQNHYHSSENDEHIKDAERLSSKIVIVMNQILGKDAYHFGSFIEHLTITEKEIYIEFHKLLRDRILVDKTKINEIIFFREYSPKLIIRDIFTDEIYDLNLTILKDDYHFNTVEETKKYFEKREIDLKQLFFGDCLPNKSDILAAKASELWYKKINENNIIDNFSFFINQKFDKDLLNELFKNLKKSYSIKLNITSKIANRIKDYVDIDKNIDIVVDMLAHITAATINEFVVSAGWNYYSVDDIQKLKETNSVNKLNLTFPNDPEIFPSIIRVNDENSNSMSVEKLLDYMDNLNENLSKNPIDMKSIENVPMMKNYRRWRELMKISFIYTCNIPSYDIEGNRRLGGILDNLKKYDDKFSISK